MVHLCSKKNIIQTIGLGSLKYLIFIIPVN